MIGASESPWSDEFLLGYGPMDDIHREFVDLVHAMQVVADEAFPALLDRFAAHLQRHFDEEKAWMSADGFPARDCHVEEHDKVMASVREVQRMVAGGDIDVGRRLAAALEEWFPGHAAYMDSALAQWLVKRRAGGAPLVLRRPRKTPQAEGLS
jgi:hemerythrin